MQYCLVIKPNSGASLRFQSNSLYKIAIEGQSNYASRVLLINALMRMCWNIFKEYNVLNLVGAFHTRSVVNQIIFDVINSQAEG